jgi:hypothetical protein
LDNRGEKRSEYGATCTADSTLQKITRKYMQYEDDVIQNAEFTWIPKSNEVQQDKGDGN